MLRYYYLIFTLSGFAGLIYESIWSHYLKLFLGHAAYAQTLVLAIFMGGMAVGSWICSVKTSHWRRLLLAYALVEAIIGLAALLFHPIFDSSINLSYQYMLPGMSPATAELYKWSLSALLILPQSILLGMTFPLMSVGIIRGFPGHPGNQIAILYFCNSIGAAVGVLVSGFLFIDWVGLPGSMQIAGVINLILAAIVYRLNKPKAAPEPIAVDTTSGDSNKAYFRLLLWIAGLTGAASFIYEIVWLRMLSLVLGASTHGFELMLSAFILGLALGGLWIRRRIESYRNVLVTLGLVQLVMGVLAVASLPLYNHSFDLMQWLRQSLSLDDTGYFLFNLSSHFIASAIMLPVTFCAGMTLPLITYALIKQQQGERSVGAVYAANTVGAIIGVFFATHIGMPNFGVKGLLLIGAGIDMGLGLMLLYRYQQGENADKLFNAYVSVVAVSLLGVGLFHSLDLYKMSSGVYRHGKLYDESQMKVLFHKDGKVATIDLQRFSDGGVSIRTNGKPDANIQMDGDNDISLDEPTMVLAAALPLAIKPNAKQAAVIGMGSGLSTHTLLSHAGLESVDTVEIEPAVIEASNGFRPRVERAYSDPRSHFHIDDAKTYFSNYNKRYDIIISEPSNPWVSGTASLFTEEFYRFLPNYMSEDSVLAQWVQLYELDMRLFASVLKALGKHFKYYEIYAATDADVIILASNHPNMGLHPGLFQQPAMTEELAKIKVTNSADIRIRFIADRNTMEPLIQSYDIAANSDYYPVLDLGASKARYLRLAASDLITSGFSMPPVASILSGKTPYDYGRPSGQGSELVSMGMLNVLSERLRDFMVKQVPLPETAPKLFINSANTMLAAFERCEPVNDSSWKNASFRIARGSYPFLTAQEFQAMWARFTDGPCFARLSPQQQDWLTLFKSLGEKRYVHASGLAQWLLQHDIANSDEQRYFLADTALLGYAVHRQKAEAEKFWAAYRAKLGEHYPERINSRMLLARLGLI